MPCLMHEALPDSRAALRNNALPSRPSTRPDLSRSFTSALTRVLLPEWESLTTIPLALSDSRETQVGSKVTTAVGAYHCHLLTLS